MNRADLYNQIKLKMMFKKRHEMALLGQQGKKYHLMWEVKKEFFSP